MGKDSSVPVSVLELSAGRSVVVHHVDGDSLIADRLLDMGIHPGVELELISRMPLGGPFVIRIESSFLALREEEAQCLKVKL